MYKPGQRVKFVRLLPNCIPSIPLGTEGTIHSYVATTCHGKPGWWIDYDGHSRLQSLPEELEPLIDPGFAKFMEKVLELIKEEV